LIIWHKGKKMFFFIKIFKYFFFKKYFPF